MVCIALHRDFTPGGIKILASAGFKALTGWATQGKESIRFLLSHWWVCRGEKEGDKIVTISSSSQPPSPPLKGWSTWIWYLRTRCNTMGPDEAHFHFWISELSAQLLDPLLGLNSLSPCPHPSGTWHFLLQMHMGYLWVWWSHFLPNRLGIWTWQQILLGGI